MRWARPRPAPLSSGRGPRRSGLHLPAVPARVAEPRPRAYDDAMAHMRVTLRDVARQVGVHPSTVSRVLNPATRGMVSPEIAERFGQLHADAAFGFMRWSSSHRATSAREK